jgi:hypothetical protein
MDEHQYLVGVSKVEDNWIVIDTSGYNCNYHYGERVGVYCHEISRPELEVLYCIDVIEEKC